MRILTVVGARPQFVKAGMVSRALRSFAGVEEIMVHTGQHYDANLSQIFFTELDIPQPACNVGIGSGTHGMQTGRILEGVERVLLEKQPDLVLVYGDTNSTLAGALAASKLHIQLAHVEAGLRSFNRKMPEETNRVLTDHISDLLFAPTLLAVSNLEREGISGDSVVLSGDVMYDAAIYYGDRAERICTVMNRLHLKPREYMLATVHRPENVDSEECLRNILKVLSEGSQGMPVIFPLHPRTRQALNGGRFRPIPDTVKFIDPIGYLDMITLEKNARLIATDSGGIQKEAFYFSVPCITLRGETEWQELIEMGWNRLAPPLHPEIMELALQQALAGRPDAGKNPFGDGHAAELIARHLFGSDFN